MNPQVASQPFIRWDWVIRHADSIAQRTIDHLVLTGIAVGVGLVLSVLAVLVVLRWRRLEGPVIGVSGVVYTIPSLALMAVLVPFTGLSLLTAEIALVSYTLLILVRNIVTGLDGVPPEAKETAAAMGYRPWRILVEVEVPLALPVILAGVRIATVTIIGLVTVTALIGQGGLGAFILDGLRRNFTTPIVVGAVGSVLLALALDAVLLAVEKLLTPWARVS